MGACTARRQRERIGLRDSDGLGHDERVDVFLEATEPNLALLLFQQIVRHDAEADARLERREYAERAVDSSPCPEVALAITRRRGADETLVLPHATCGEQSPKPLLARIVDAAVAQHHLSV